jgi:uncharacterized protein DUF6292
VTAVLDATVGASHPALGVLRDYLESVAAEFGVGLESCTIDEDTPVSAYLALDIFLPHLPGRDVALLWDEEHGWALGAETRSGGGVLVVRYLGESVCPPPARVRRFVSDARTVAHPPDGETFPPSFRRASDHDALIHVLPTGLDPWPRRS